MEEFKDLGLSDEVLASLKRKGYEKPTEIQAKAIPFLLDGTKDVVGQSQTGTGKTASFALPIIEKLKGNSKTPKALILTPTRELASQVSKEIESLQPKNKLKILAVYGGASINEQIKHLKYGIDVVVGTPGRLIDLIKRRKLDLKQIRYAVLDEADEMLNMGFLDDIKEILSKTNSDKNTLLFSATMPKEILNIAKKFMRDYEFIKVKKQQVTIELTEQFYYDVRNNDRFECLRRVIDISPEFYGIVFCKTRSAVNSLVNHLLDNNYSAGAIHGEITQSQREKVLLQFRNKRIKILVATDVAARGIDVNDLTHVINYSLPQSPESYVHRVGRTGRAGKKGIAITFVMPSEKGKLKFVERIIKQKLERKEIPVTKDVIESKIARMEQTIHKLLSSKRSDKFDELASQILKAHQPKEVVASLLNFAFKKEITASGYKEIGKVSSSDRGRSRDRRDRKPRREERDRHGRRDRPRRSHRDRPGRGNRDRPGKRDESRGESRSEGRSQKRDGPRREDKPKKSFYSDRKKNKSGGRSSKRASNKRRSRERRN